MSISTQVTKKKLVYVDAILHDKTHLRATNTFLLVQKHLMKLPLDVLTTLAVIVECPNHK